MVLITALRAGAECMLLFNILFTWLLLNYRIIYVHCSAEETCSYSSLSLSDSDNFVPVNIEIDEASMKSDQSTGADSSSIIERIGTLSPVKSNQYGTNTILIVDRKFQRRWINILSSLQSQLPLPTPDLIPGFSLSANSLDPQLRLLNGIKSDNAFEVNRAILEGARLLSINPDNRIRTRNYCPVEHAVVTNKLESLKVMLDQIISINSNDKLVFLGCLLIRAVQSGHIRVIELLFDNYQTVYLKNSFLLQQAIMHNAPVSVMKFIIDTYSSVSETSQPYGAHQDSALHLAVKYNNYRAFAFLFEQTKFPKNLFNADSLRPIDLIFKVRRNNFLSNLFLKYPNLRSHWTDENGNNMLHLAVNQKSLEHIKFLVENLKFFLDHVNNEYQTALFIALSLHLRQIALYLLENGANVLIPDKTGISPLLVIARLGDMEAFNTATNLILLQVIIVDNLKIFTRSLIKENHWKFVDVMLVKFPCLMTINFKIYTEQLEHLVATSSLYDFPKLVEYFILMKFIDPQQLILKAVAIGKVEIVKYLLEIGETGEIGGGVNALLEVAIDNSQNEMIRFLLSLSFGDLFISQDCPLKYFVLVLMNGASFSPNSPSKLNSANRNIVLFLFSKYFSILLKTRVFEPKELAVMLLQLEIFIFYHFIDKPISKKITASLNKLIHLKYLIFLAINTENNSLSSLALNFTPKNTQYLRSFIECRFPHSISTEDLSSLISPENIYLLSEYSSII